PVAAPVAIPQAEPVHRDEAIAHDGAGGHPRILQRGGYGASSHATASSSTDAFSGTYVCPTAPRLTKRAGYPSRASFVADSSMAGRAASYAPAARTTRRIPAARSAAAGGA